MSKIHIGNIGTVNGNVTIGDGSIQNNDGTQNYSLNSCIQEAFKGFDETIELSRKSGLQDSQLSQLKNEKEQIFHAANAVISTGQMDENLSQKIGKFVSTFRSLTNAFDESVGITQKLTESVFKLTPILIPAIAQGLGIV